MTPTDDATGDASPPDEIARLLRLLARRGAAIAIPPAAADVDDDRRLRVTARAGLVGLVAPRVWASAYRAGLVRVAADGAGRLTPAGIAWLKRRASAPGAPGEASRAEATSHAPPAVDAPSASAEPAAAERPGFNADESPLGWLARRRDKSGRPMIDARELAAGERFRADFHFARMAPRVTANWSLDAPSGRSGARGGVSAVELRDNVVAAQERVRRALAAVGPELAGVLVDVCGLLVGLEHAERNAGWPARSGKVVLQLALQALARHYGMNDGRATGASAVRHWAREGYRPALDGGIDHAGEGEGAAAD